jgi:hypothetical protein
MANTTVFYRGTHGKCDTKFSFLTKCQETLTPLLKPYKNGFKPQMVAPSKVVKFDFKFNTVSANSSAKLHRLIIELIALLTRANPTLPRKGVAISVIKGCMPFIQGLLLRLRGGRRLLPRLRGGRRLLLRLGRKETVKATLTG